MLMYVDGFVIPVKKSRLDEYKKMAELGSKVWMDHGAVSYCETIGDDVPYGELTSFPRAVQAEEDETIIFSWVVYPNKATRDDCMAKVMADPRMEGSMANAPFDGKRMIFGGFEVFIQV
jgi:uncharacterized protein YbaA (DUF1428 family)